VQQVRAGLPACSHPSRSSTIPRALAGAPETFQSTAFRSNGNPGQRYTVAGRARKTAPVARSASQVCPAKDKTNPRHKAIDMVSQPPLLAAERANWDFFMDLPDPDRTRLDLTGSRARSSRRR